MWSSMSKACSAISEQPQVKKVGKLFKKYVKNKCNVFKSFLTNSWGRSLCLPASTHFLYEESNVSQYSHRQFLYEEDFGWPVCES